MLEIVTTWFDEGSDPLKAKIVYHDYYARGVGLVKSVSEDFSGDASHRVEQVLIEYRFPPADEAAGAARPGPPSARLQRM